MAKSDYLELLRDPRWQRMRLETMNRDGFKCRSCGNDKSTLNVHHRYYVRGRAPWEYDPDTLRTLCEPCHERAELMREALAHSVAQVDERDEHFVLGFIQGISCKRLAMEGRNSIANVMSDEQAAGLDLGFGCEKGATKAAVDDSPEREARFKPSTDKPEPVL